MIKTIDCNLLEVDADVIFHCCNVFHTMGAGVALAIKNEYPEAYEADCQTVKGDKDKLGTVSLAVVKDPTKHKNQNIKAIANLYGQFGFGKGNRPLSYDALYDGLVNLKSRLKPTLKAVALPYKLGCGLANGSWPVVEKMIDDIFKDVLYDVIICKFDNK